MTSAAQADDMVLMQSVEEQSAHDKTKALDYNPLLEIPKGMQEL